MKTAVVITAAGHGARMGAAMPKQFLPLNDVPVLARTIKIFEQLDEVSAIVVTVPEDWIKYTQDRIVEPCGFTKTMVIGGGKDRQQSVFKGLRALNEDTDIVLIHDGARPFVTKRVIRDVAACAAKGFAAVAGVKTIDTVKLTDDDGLVLSTPPRERVWAVQTPQGFTYDIITKAHQLADSGCFTGTDDAVLVERFGLAPVRMVWGDYHNIKITTPEDMLIGALLLTLADTT